MPKVVLEVVPKVVPEVVPEVVSEVVPEVVSEVVSTAVSAEVFLGSDFWSALGGAHGSAPMPFLVAKSIKTIRGHASVGTD